MRRDRMSLPALVLGVALVLVVAAAAWSQEPEKRETRSLYDRLGGLPAISVVVSDFIDAMVVDSMLNSNPAIDAARKRVPAAYLSYQVTSMMCQASGGPCQYTGRPMAPSHAHLNITDAEWDRMVVILEGVLAKYKVPPQETAEVMAIIESTKGDIVTVK